MRKLFPVILILFVLISCSTAKNNSPLEPQPETLQGQSVISVDLIKTMFLNDLDAPAPGRYASSDFDTFQLREWMAWWFADYYGTQFANSLFDEEYMISYLYCTAVYRDGDDFYVGCYDLFMSPTVFDDFFIILLADMIEYTYGYAPYWPPEVIGCD